MTVPMADGKEPATPAADSATPDTASLKTASAETLTPEVSAPEATAPVMAAVESPPLAPTEPVPAVAPEVRAEVREPAGEPASAETTSAIAPSSLTGGLLPPLRMPKLSRRTRWRGMIAASIAFAAGVGAAAGAVIAGTRAPPPAPIHDEFAASERAAMQKTIAKLTKDVTTLRANLDAATKTANTQLAKLNERVSERIASEKQAERHAAAAAASQDVTGSIAAPATAATAVPVPTPRPVVQVDAKADAKPEVKPVETRPVIVAGWSIRSVRDGVALIENRGEVYEVVPGAPLPGLGRVEAVRRQDGRWVVVTPKGLIVAARMPAPPRAYYERF
ncbi:MAG: hypothetical protein AB7U62_03885 [Pseudolabrys sp.]